MEPKAGRPTDLPRVDRRSLRSAGYKRDHQLHLSVRNVPILRDLMTSRIPAIRQISKHACYEVAAQGIRDVNSMIPPSDTHVLLAPLTKLTYFGQRCQKFVSFAGGARSTGVLLGGIELIT